MNGSARAAAALGVGYVLGRRRKLRTAALLAAATAVGGKGIGGMALQRGMRMLGSTEAIGKIAPQLGEITDTVRGDLLPAGKAAVSAAVTSRVDSLAGSLHDRAEQLRNPAGTVAAGAEGAKKTTGRATSSAGRAASSAGRAASGAARGRRLGGRGTDAESEDERDVRDVRDEEEDEYDDGDLDDGDLEHGEPDDYEEGEPADDYDEPDDDHDDGDRDDRTGDRDDRTGEQGQAGVPRRRPARRTSPVSRVRR